MKGLSLRKKTIILFILIVCFSFSSIRAESAIELSLLQKKAKEAWQKGNLKVAKEHYQELLGKIDETKTNEHTYADSILSYAEVLIALGELETAHQELKHLLSKNPPSDTLIPLKLLLARSRSGQDGWIQSFLEMREIEKRLSTSFWPSSMRLFYNSIIFTLNEYFDNLAKKADRYYIVKDYAAALDLYQQIQEAIEKGGYPRACTEPGLIKKNIRLKTAKSRYHCLHHKKNKMAEEGALKDEIDCELLSLAAQSHKNGRAYLQAIDSFENKGMQGSVNEREHYLKALYELGSLYYKNENFIKAKQYLTKLVKYNESNNLTPIRGRITLAEIYIKEKNFDEALLVLQQLDESLSEKSPLYEKSFFLKGYICMQKKEYAKAITYFTQALPTSRQKENIVLHLISCHFSLEKEHNLEQAEKKIHYLLKTKERERALLLQACLHLKKNKLEDACALLQKKGEKFTLENQLFAHLLMAQALYDENKKQDALCLATDPAFACCKNYSYGWFCKGIYELEHNLLKEATYSLETALSFVKSQEPDEYEYDLQQYLQCHKQLVYLPTETNCELLYLYSLSAFYTKHENIALEGFRRIIEINASAEFHDKAQLMLGTLLFKMGRFSEAKAHFLELTKNTSSPLMAEGWHGAAECEEKLNPGSDQISKYHQSLYENYPKSLFSSQSYFKIFSLENYLRGESAALNHLSHFSKLFPKSTLNIAVYYLLSLHTQSKHHALQLLEKSILFPASKNSGISYFQTKALIRKAELLRDGKIEEAIMILEPLVKQLEQDDYTGLPLLLIESQYILAESYIKNQQYKKAQELLFTLIETYTRCGVSEGYFLSLAWESQGKLASQNGDRELARECYTLSLKSMEKH